MKARQKKSNKQSLSDEGKPLSMTFWVEKADICLPLQGRNQPIILEASKSETVYQECPMGKSLYEKAISLWKDFFSSLVSSINI